MKQIALVAFYMTIGLLSAAQSKVSTVKIKASIYCDHCRRCESCGDRLQNAAFTEKGVTRVDIDEKTKTLCVVYNPQKTSPEKIREAIAKVGFDADDVKADTNAYEKLDPCCKK